MRPAPEFREGSLDEEIGSDQRTVEVYDQRPTR
jgi:hypothetical protein